jgi:hypothetical protein
VLEHFPAEDGRAPWIALQEELGQLRRGEAGRGGAGFGVPAEPLEHGHQITLRQAPFEGPFDVALQSTDVDAASGAVGVVSVGHGALSAGAFRATLASGNHRDRLENVLFCVRKIRAARAPLAARFLR